MLVHADSWMDSEGERYEHHVTIPLSAFRHLLDGVVFNDFMTNMNAWDAAVQQEERDAVYWRLKYAVAKYFGEEEMQTIMALLEECKDSEANTGNIIEKALLIHGRSK